MGEKQALTDRPEETIDDTARVDALGWYIRWLCEEDEPNHLAMFWEYEEVDEPGYSLEAADKLPAVGGDIRAALDHIVREVAALRDE